MGKKNKNKSKGLQFWSLGNWKPGSRQGVKFILKGTGCGSVSFPFQGGGGLSRDGEGPGTGSSKGDAGGIILQ